MKLINNTEKDQIIPIKREKYNGHLIVRKGQIIEIEEKDLNAALRTGLTEVKSFKSKIGNKKIETKVIDSYKKKILTIKGIGKKTFNDILELYPTQKELIKAIKKGKLPLRDDIEKKLKRKFR